ncbi:MAG: hypothetical protein V4659_13160 [Pseudomonadota bacterium]
MTDALDDQLTQDARLVILRELSKQRDARLNEVALIRALDVFGFRRSRDWVRTQFNVLAELGAIRVTEVGDFKVATLRQAGRAHVDRRALLEGVARPADDD